MAERKRALGRGLDALFGDIETKVPVAETHKSRGKAGEEDSIQVKSAAAQEGAVLYIDINDIKPNTMQPRQSFSSESIEDLAASIETYGVIQPILLQAGAKGYELVAGERRWRAARKAGLKTIPAIIRKVTSEENALIAIIENMQREDLNPVEEATAYRNIIRKYGMTQETLAKAVGKSRPYIANTLRALSLPPKVVDMLRTGDLTLGHANALGAVKDADKLEKLADKVVKNGLSVRETEQLASAQGRQKAPTQKKNDSKSYEIRAVEQELTSFTGVRVVISGDERKGSVELRYFDKQGLEEIIDLLRGTSRN